MCLALLAAMVRAGQAFVAGGIRAMQLKNKVALVTGGARGIGRAVALRYAAEGAFPVVADLHAGEAEALAAEIRAGGGRAMAVPLDVTRAEAIEAAIVRTVEQAGSLDVLFNNAGIFEMQPVLEITRESWDRVFEVNTKGLFFTLQAAARRMVEQGRGGKVINLASEAGRQGQALVLHYCASKAAVISITQSAGLALIPHGINVNAIAPGVIDTPMWDTVDSLFAVYENLKLGEKKRQVARAVPHGRMGVPADIVGAAVFLASADSDYIVGQTLNVDGGRMLD
jgi:D-sorbitol dehydrogenase (acceptor)